MMTAQQQTRGVPLGELFAGLAAVPAGADRMVTGISLDSRRIRPGDLFLACRGQRTSGVRFINAAIQAGAVAVAVESGAQAAAAPGVAVIAVPDLGRQAGVVAARFHGEPSRSLDVIGVTGTNGKTSVAWFLAQALTARDGWQAGVLGTLGYGPYGQLQPALNTTPDAVTLQRELAALRDAGATRAVLEVSSHGLVQGRVAGVHFHSAVFTNLSVDHLDYHGDMESYGNAKRQLFLTPGLRHAVLNLDDEFGRRLSGDLAGRLPVTGYALNGETGAAPRDLLRAGIIEHRLDALELEIRSPRGTGRLRVGFGGRFNAHNLLASLGGLLVLEIPFPEALALLAEVTPVPGRLEPFRRPGAPLVIVDYAHTPDALAKVLATLREYCRGRLVCVFGCGGDRDRGKRPRMGAVAHRHADRIILTSDNPRTEDPEAIIRDIAAGIDGAAGVEILPDRAAAMAAAITGAAADDVVLIAGKGHENYQEIGRKRFPFSDRQLVRNLLGGGA